MPIIISDDLVLSESQQPLTHARIGWQSLARDVENDDILANSTADGFSRLAPKHGLTYEHWQALDTPAYWGFDYGSPVEADFAGIAGHSLGTNGLTVKVQCSDDGMTWTDASDDMIPADDRPIMFLFEAQTKRYWRIHMDGVGDPARVAVVYVGKVLQMMRPIYGGHSPVTLSRTTVIDPNTSENGQWLGRSIRRTGHTTSADFRHLKPGWYRDNFDPFVLSARKYPFFFAWRPSKYPQDVGFMWTSDDIQPTNMGTRDLMEVSFSMSGLGGYE